MSGSLLMLMRSKTAAMAAAMLGVLFWSPFAAASSSSDVGDRIAETLAEHPIEYSNALFGAMQSESAVLGFPGDGLFTAKAELVNAGETGYAVYLTADPASARPGGEAVHYHFAGAEKKGGAERAGKLGDLFVLGDFRKPYYINKASIEDRDTGLVYIFYFDTDHATVQLHGSSSDYELVELDELPKAETRGGGRFGRGDRAGGGGSRFAERILGRIGRDQGSRGGTAIVWRETLDVVGVLVGVSIDELEGGLTGRAFTYDTPPSGQATYPTGVQVSHAGLSAGGKYVAAADDGDTYLVASAPGGISGVPGDGVLYVGRFAPDGSPRWQRMVGGSRGPDGAAVEGDTPADLIAVGDRLYVVTVRRYRGAAGGVAGATNATRVYAIDGRDGRVVDLYEPEFAGGRAGGEAWSAGSGIATDHAGAIYVSGEQSVGHSATPFLLKLDADGLDELWRMGAYGLPDGEADDESVDRGDRRARLRKLLKMRRAGRGGDTGGGGRGIGGGDGLKDKLLKEAWGGVAFWRDPDASDGRGIAYVSGYRWDSGDSPLTAWVAAVDSDGERLWLEEFAGPGYEWPWATTVDRDGNVYVGGITTSPEGLHTHGPEPQGAGDGFIAKYSPNGRKLWVRCVTGPDGQEVKDLQVVGDELFAIGHTFGDFPVPPSNAADVDPDAPPQSDIYVVRYDLDGNARHAARLGSSRHERATFDIKDGVIHLGGRTFGSFARVKDTAGVEPFLLRLDARSLEPIR